MTLFMCANVELLSANNHPWLGTSQGGRPSQLGGKMEAARKVATLFKGKLEETSYQLRGQKSLQSLYL